MSYSTFSSNLYSLLDVSILTLTSHPKWLESKPKSFHNIYMYQTIMLCTLNLHNVIYQLCFNKNLKKIKSIQNILFPSTPSPLFTYRHKFSLFLSKVSLPFSCWFLQISVYPSPPPLSTYTSLSFLIVGQTDTLSKEKAISSLVLAFSNSIYYYLFFFPPFKERKRFLCFLPPFYF